MAFLDRKEQVLDTQLTQYGKRLLSKGKFKPAYYAFYDDDIIYDPNWAGLDEEQNEAEDRIKEAVRPEVQYVFSGIESKIKEQNKTISSPGNTTNNKEIQNEADKEFMVPALGTADPHSSYVPAWNITFLEGNYTGSVSQTYKTGSLELKIPQMEIDMTYTIKVAENSDPLDEDGNIEFRPAIDGVDDHEYFKFPDNTYHFLDTYKGNLFLRVLEKNSHFLNENHDIEVFVYNEDDELRKLSFMKDEVLIKDDILLDQPEKVQVKDFGPDYVEYYFDILVDKEIDNDIYCASIKSQTLEDAFTDDDTFNCEDLAPAEATSDIYRISKEVEEIC